MMFGKVYVFTGLSKKREREKVLLQQQLAALQRQNQCLQSVVANILEKEKAQTERMRILQLMASKRVVGDAERFLKEG